MTPIELNDFCIHLGERITLKKTSLKFEEGSSTVIMGITGTGKSVFLKSIAGILPSTVFSYEGNMKINEIEGYKDGKKLDYEKWTQIEKSGLMFVPAETAQVMNAALTLDQNLKLLAPGCREKIVQRLNDYFKLDFEAFARLYPDEVSGGEMQRITLMILLSRQGNLILLDEPTVNLDRDLRKNFAEFLDKEILSDSSKTFLMVSHDVDFIKRLTNLKQRFILKDGVLEKIEDELSMDGNEKPDIKTDASIPSIELKEVSQSYKKRGIFGERKFTAFKKLNLGFSPSVIYGVTGPSGCGKSSMVKAILRLLDETEGQIIMKNADGENDLVALKPKENGRDPVRFKPYRRKMAIVQQDSRFSFFPDLKIKDSFAQITKAGNEGTLEEFSENLEKVGLTKEHLESYPQSLSSGEMKRMDIARALTAKPDVLLLDEPFAHIDFKTRAQVMDVIAEYLRAHATILIVVTHEDYDLNHFITQEYDFPKLVGMYAEKK